MKQILVFITFFVGFSVCHAQFAFTAKYNQSSFPTWEEIQVPDDNPFMSNSFELGLAYWFRLKKRRLEFLPEIIYNQAHGEHSSVFDDQFLTSLTKKTVGFQMNVQFYPMDFASDCDCPTFSKDGNFFTKGFFLGISPGYNLHFLEVETNLASENESQAQGSFRIGGYLGIDIGITELITISPILQFNHTLETQWDGIEQALNGQTALLREKSTIQELQPGLRIIFRPDYLRKNRGWRR